MSFHAYQCKTPGCLYSTDGWGSGYCQSCEEAHEEVRTVRCDFCPNRVHHTNLCRECGLCPGCCECGAEQSEGSQ